MGEDMPIELRPKFNFHIYDSDTGEIIETLWDIQYSLAMDRLTELHEIDSSRILEVSRVAKATSPEEVTYTNIVEMLEGGSIV